MDLAEPGEGGSRAGSRPEKCSSVGDLTPRLQPGVRLPLGHEQASGADNSLSSSLTYPVKLLSLFPGALWSPQVES